MATSQKWKCCRGHEEHHVFLSYRTSCDVALAEMLAEALRSDSLTVFLDQHCLTAGESREMGTLHGLQSSKVAVLLITERALEGIRDAHDTPNNMLHEYEEALRLHEAGQCAILPVLVGHGLDADAQMPTQSRGVADISLQRLLQSVLAAQSIWADPKDLPHVVRRIHELVQQYDCLPAVHSMSLAPSTLALVATKYCRGGYYTASGMRLGDLPAPPPGSVMDDGDFYEGEFRDGKANGRGRYIAVGGNLYEGAFRDGLQNGHGTFFYVTGPRAGDRYVGGWRNGRQQGFGKQFFASGKRYEGQWHEGKMHGAGKYFLGNGTRYEGDWWDGKQQGQGKCFYANGDRYEGLYRDDMKQGQGKLFYANGDRYEGEWQDGLRQGQGMMLLANGERYEGGWRDGKKHGQGTVFNSSGSIKMVGTWQNGAFVGTTA